MKKTFYITTPIYYANGKFHIGTTYTTCLCDVLNRYKIQQGYDGYFLTGLDEHGVKIETVAKEKGIKPQQLVDEVATLAKDLWKKTDIQYDDFIRTTDARHVKVVEDIYERLIAQDDIYLGSYEGEYCVPCESFWTKTQVGENHVCPDCGRETKLVKEECYFLRLSKYADRLLEYIEDNPDFITPETKKNEVVSFINQGLNDLCVSRTTFSWGVKIKSNPKHVAYVWIDALANYISALGYDSDHPELFEKYWLNGDEIVHVVGKDILRFHAIFWPIMLMALDIPINFKLYAHGWYMMKDGKMSKSKGNLIYPDPLIERYGIDAYKYYIVRELPYGSDGVFTPEDFVQRINNDLVNDYGNLVKRTVAMADKYFNKCVLKVDVTTDLDTYLEDALQVISNSKKAYFSYMDQFKVPQALQQINVIVSRLNKLIDETAPWVLAKDEGKKIVLEKVMYYLLEGIRISTVLYEPYLVNKVKDVYQVLGLNEKEKTLEYSDLSKDKYTVLSLDEPLFPRLDIAKEVEAIKGFMAKPKVEEPKIEYDDFAKVNFVVGEIIEASKHPKADKLLVFKINIGDEVRQIVSGIAAYYKPDSLIGKKVIVVKNLKPVVLRGVESAGMLLCASSNDGLELITLANAKAGDIVN